MGSTEKAAAVMNQPQATGCRLTNWFKGNHRPKWSKLYPEWQGVVRRLALMDKLLMP
jgi:hypothetical protein